MAVDRALSRAAAIALTSLAFGLPACGGGERGPATGTEPTVRDSAGVRIVENPAEALERAATWSLSPEPLLEIGTVHGPPEQQLFRVSGVTLLPDGRVLIVNAGSSEVRVFAPDGEYLLAFGAEGEGPGEFRLPFGTWRLGGDSLLIWDPPLRRVSLFTIAGRHLVGARLEGAISNPVLAGIFEDRTLLVTDNRYDIPEVGFRMMHTEYLRHDLRGQFVDSLGRHPLAEFGHVEAGGRSFVGGPVFAPRTVHTAEPRGYWVGRANGYEVRRYAPSGELVAIVRWEGPDLSVREEGRDRYREMVLANAETLADSQRALDFLEQQSFSERLPAYSELYVDRVSNLWVQGYRPRHERATPAGWTVFDPEGRLVARVEMPASFYRPREIGEDYVLTLVRDELDVEYVRLYGLRTP